MDKSLEDFTDKDLLNANIKVDEEAIVEFESGVTVTGIVTNILRKKDKIIVISFKDCLVKTLENDILFDPNWGIYDMAVGESVTSVFCGAADKDAYEEIAYLSKSVAKQVSYSKKTENLHQIYQQVRDIRNQKIIDFKATDLYLKLRNNHSEDWLCALELVEILEQYAIEIDLREEITNYLKSKIDSQPELKKLITDGIQLIAQPVHQLITQ